MKSLLELDFDELNSYFEDCASYFENEHPSQEEFERYVISSGFGVSEALALGTLLYAIWCRFNPRKDQSMPLCSHLVRGLKGKARKKCGMRFVHTEDHGDLIILYCLKKHVTKLRIK